MSQEVAGMRGRPPARGNWPRRSESSFGVTSWRGHGRALQGPHTDPAGMGHGSRVPSPHVAAKRERRGTLEHSAVHTGKRGNGRDAAERERERTGSGGEP